MDRWMNIRLLIIFAATLFPLQAFAQGGKKAPGDVHLIVLGIAQDAGYPQSGCNQACCEPAWKDATKRRLASCIAVVDSASGRRILFDCTPDFPRQLRMLDEVCAGMHFFDQIPSKTSVDAIFLTHAHIGHYTGLMHLGREAMGSRNTDVWGMPRMKKFLETNGPWSQLVKLKNVDVQRLAANEAVSKYAGVEVTPVLVPHRDEFSETVGFRISGPTRTALYLPDIDKWSKWDQSIVDVIRSVDVAYLDGTFLENGEIPGRDMSTIPHPFIAESVKLFSSLDELERDKIRFIHLNHTNPALSPDGEARKMIRRAGMHVAEQGEKIRL